MSKTEQKNQEGVVDAIHKLMDANPDVSALLSQRVDATGRDPLECMSVLDLLNAALSPCGVGPLALMVDGKGNVMGVGVARRKP